MNCNMRNLLSFNILITICGLFLFSPSFQLYAQVKFVSNPSLELPQRSKSDHILPFSHSDDPDTLKYKNDKIRWALESSILFSTFNAKKYAVSNIESRLGFGFGASGEHSINIHSKVSFGMQYVNQGVTFNSYYTKCCQNNGLNFIHKMTMHELQIPVHYKYILNPRSTTSFFGELGISTIYLILVRGRIKSIDSDSINLIGNVDINFRDYLHLGDDVGFAFIGSIGSQIDLKNKKMDMLYAKLNLRFNLSNMSYGGIHPGSPFPTNDFSIHNFYLALIVGVFI